MEKSEVMDLAAGQHVTVRFVGLCSFVADMDGLLVMVEHEDGARFMVPCDWVEPAEDLGEAMQAFELGTAADPAAPGAAEAGQGGAL